MSFKVEFKNYLDELHKSLCEVSDWMYENPELGFKNSKHQSIWLTTFRKTLNL